MTMKVQGKKLYLIDLWGCHLITSQIQMEPGDLFDFLKFFVLVTCEGPNTSDTIVWKR